MFVWFLILLAYHWLCVLRWRGAMLARATNYSCDIARRNAAIMLINAFAHFCYTVQAKYSYYCGGRLPKALLNTPEKPGEYKVVSKDEIVSAVTGTLKALREKGASHYCPPKGVDAAHVRVVLNIIDEFFKKKNRYCELLFGGKSADVTISELRSIAMHAHSIPWLQWRSIKGRGTYTAVSRRLPPGGRGMYTAVSRRFTPQQLCSYILSVGGDTVRYRLLPPQPPWIELLMFDCQYSPNIVKLQTQPQAPPAQSSFKDKSAKRGKRGKWK